MTAADVTGWLDRLDETHTAATPGPWRVAYPFTKLVDVPDREAAITAERAADAAAIVAAHNHVPALIAAVRAVLALADELHGMGQRIGTATAGDLIRTAVGAEVTGR